jgi:hypothetical protein
MVFKFAAAFVLLGLTVLINAFGLTLAMRRLHLVNVATTAHLRKSTWLLIRLATWVVAIHTVAISTWAFFYWWQECLPTFESSFYFSIITYTTVGYGDIILEADWRLLAGVEALTGILMCGLSTGYFFAVVNRLHTLRVHASE